MHPSNEIDIAIIQHALNNDESACQKILNLYKGRIFSYVYRIVRNYHDAEDLTSETFIKCFKALASFDQKKSFSTWLFTIAHNLVIDFLRKNKHEYEYLDERHSVNDDFVQVYEKKKKFEMIEKALSQLPHLDQEIIILFHKEEYSYEEISEVLNLPVSTIKTRLHRARIKLSQLVHLK